MKKIVLVASAAVMLMGMALVGAGETTPAEKAQTVKHQTVCPVMGGEIDKTIFADYQGQRVYFCCNGCPPAFKKDPAKFITKMEKEGITLDKAPVEAPKK